MRAIIIPLLAIGALSACSTADEGQLNTMAVGQAAIVQTFTVTTDAAVYNPGGTATFTITGAPANAYMAMFWTDAGEGAGPCPGILQGGCLDILPSGTAGGFYYLPQADASGSMVSAAAVPAGIPYADYTFQAVAYNPATGAITGAAPVTITHEEAAPTCIDDAYEPNDGPLDTIPAAPAADFGLQICEGSRVDWFAIDLVAGETLNADIFFSDAEGDLDLYLTDAVVEVTGDADLAANYFVRGYSGSDDESITYTAAAAGTYYLAVHMFGDDGTFEGNTYDITTSTYTIVDCAVDDVFEDNDAEGDAANIFAGLTTGLAICDADGDDWYAIDLIAGQTVDITVDWDELIDADDDLDFAVYDGIGGSQVVNANSTDPEEVDSFVAAVTGTHYIHVEAWNTGADTLVDYTMDIVVTDPVVCAVEEASEDNDDALTAAAVTFPYVGYVCAFDTQDWYQLPVLTGDTVDVFLDILDEVNDDLDVYVYDGSGTEIGNGFTTNDEEILGLVAAADETWTIQVDYWDGTATGEYSLDVLVTPVAVP